jgi:hypothetical protein
MLLNLSIGLLVLVVPAGQGPQTEWQVDGSVTAADKSAIIALASQFGLEHPQTVTFDSVLPTGCPFVRVKSSVTQDGYRRIWQELLLRNRKWRPCFEVPRRAITKRVGQWIASNAQLSTEEEWRIEDEGWHVDIRPGPDVSYADVQLIVRAIRRKEMVNQLPTSIGPIKLSRTMPDIDPSDIAGIEKSNAGPRMYRVRTGRGVGLILDVTIVGDKVELHFYGTWIVQFDKPPNTPLQPTAEKRGG